MQDQGSQASAWSKQIEAVPESVLRMYFTPDYPLGPLNAALVSKEHRRVTELLSERDLVPLHRAVERPSIVIGRRGSGKTSYLRRLSLQTPDELFLELRTEKALNVVLGAFYNIIRDAVAVEAVAEVWDALFWNCLFWLLHRTGRPHTGRMETTHHLRSLSIDTCRSVEEVIGSISRSVQTIARETSGFALDRTADFLKGKQFDDLKAYAISELRRANVSALIVLDSLDEHPIKVEDHRKALAGLLKCAGEFNAIARHFDLRLCLPSELYWSFEELVSTNPYKDFSSKLVVHWRVVDLLIAACRRFTIYLRLEHPRAYALVKDNPLQTRSDVDAFLTALFPSHIRNLNDQLERTDLYILRHTQLLPRQLILILTAVLRVNRVDDDFVPGKSPFVREEAVRLGVAEAEKTIVAEIFSAFRDRYENLPREACLAILPALPRVFRAADLTRAMRDYAHLHGRTVKLAAVRQMLIELGVLGKLESSDTSYFRGRFEYTMTSRVAIAPGDSLCVHPLFSRIFQCKPPHATDPPVFPIAADLSSMPDR